MTRGKEGVYDTCGKTAAASCTQWCRFDLLTAKQLLFIPLSMLYLSSFAHSRPSKSLLSTRIIKSIPMLILKSAKVLA
jgi:hypothetical protein